MVQQSANFETEIKTQIQQQESLTANLKSLTLELKELETKKKEKDARLRRSLKKLKKGELPAAALAEKKLAQAKNEIEAFAKEKTKLGAEVGGKEKLLNSNTS